MPRPRKSTDRPVKRRTRTGCQTCRKRKIKCDESRPVCTQCQARGFECNKTTALKWETEFLSKGLSFGRAGVWSKDPFKGASCQLSPSSADGVATWCTLPEIHPYSFLNLDIGFMGDLRSLAYGTPSTMRLPATSPIITSPDETQAEDSISRSSLSPWLTTENIAPLKIPVLSPPALLSMGEQRERSLLLSYYVEKVCPLTVASTSSQSPLASLLIPFAVTTSTLAMDSILALAACHRARSDRTYKRDALQRSHGALQALQVNLRTGDLWTVANNPETLTVMLLLCWFEIINECDRRWVIHLKGARDLIRIRRQGSTTLSNGSAERQLSHFCERFFAFQDIMGRTACGEDPVFGSDFWTSESSDCDPWLGCSPELVSILSRITELGRQDLPSRCSLQFQAEAASLEDRLANLEQQVGEIDVGILGQAAELKRLAAELYLQCVLNGARPSTPWVIAQIPSILRLVAVLLDSDILSGISWPLFIAAVELDPNQELQWDMDCNGAPKHARPFILAALDKLSGSVVNATKARSVIEKVWQARDLDYMPHQECDIEQDDWSRFVAPFCGNMSLA